MLNMEKSTTDEQEELAWMRLFPLPKTLNTGETCRSHTDNVHFYPVLCGNYANCSIECHADKHKYSRCTKRSCCLFHRAEVCANRGGVPNSLQHEEHECHRNAKILQGTTNVRRTIFIISSVDFLEKTCTLCRQSLAHC